MDWCLVDLLVHLTEHQMVDYSAYLLDVTMGVLWEYSKGLQLADLLDDSWD